MKKQQAIQISIPQPCSEDWQQMTPQEQGRFCDSCKKCVIDFTGFTDGQLYQYFKQHAGETVCGHFKSTQLNRAIALPPQPHSKLYRIAIALGLAIAVVATSNTDSFAKAPLSYYTQLDSYTTGDSSSTNTSDTAVIKGQVVDENGEPMINCVVELVMNDTVRYGTITDYYGNYKFQMTDITEGQSFIVRAKCVGFIMKKDEVKMVIDDVKTVNFMLHRKNENMVIGDIIIMQPYKVPLVDRDNPSPMNKTFNSDDINRMAH